MPPIGIDYTAAYEQGAGIGRYVRELIRKDQQRQHLRDLLLRGADSAPMSPANDAYFDGLRDRARRSLHHQLDRATTADKLRASLDRLAQLAES